MKKGFIFILFLLTFLTGLYSQTKDIEVQIKEYDESKASIISKGRRLLLDKFIEGDYDKVKEVKDYLVKIEDENYFAFYSIEYWFILYWTNDYLELTESIKNFKTAISSYNTRIRPLTDMLYARLQEKSVLNKNQLKLEIEISELDTETKQLLIMNLDWLFAETQQDDIYAQDELNYLADIFLETYPESKFNDFVKTYIRFRLHPSDWGVGYSFFLGYGILTDNLSDNFTNNFPIGLTFDITYKNFELYLKYYFGSGDTKKDIDFPQGTWGKDSNTLIYLPEASLAYVCFNNNRFKLSPFTGIGSMSISPPEKDIKETPELKNISLEFTTTYVIGVSFDIKFGRGNTPKYYPKTNYYHLRFNYAYSIPRFDKKYDNMSGNMHYITIGFGQTLRSLKREY